MNIILFDDIKIVSDLMPLTFTRPVSEIRIGILTITEKWKQYFDADVSWLTRDYLKTKFPANYKNENVYINGSICPDEDLFEAIEKLEKGTSLVANGKLIALKIDEKITHAEDLSGYAQNESEVTGDLLEVNYSWDIFQKNGVALQRDFDQITKGRTSQPVSSTNQVIGDQVFIEEGAKVECSILNTTTGPIYIGKDAEIMEGSVVRGGLALCEHAVLKLSAKVYGPTTIGPYSKVGGEVSNSVILGYSNKGHDGFLGNSVLGEWVNLGADTNTSNLKNNYGSVKVWSYSDQEMVNTGLQFCGLLMGDHSKSGINTMFNTGTVVGVCANVFGGGFPAKFIPSYSWGGADGFVEFREEKAFEVAEKMMGRRSVPFDEVEKAILTKVFELSAPNRIK